jgi:hypothetical protein
MITEDPVVNWLLESGDPSVRYLTLTQILDSPSDSKEVLAAKKQIPNGPIVKTLLAGQRVDGGFGSIPTRNGRARTGFLALLSSSEYPQDSEDRF